jgi:DNA-directed RNA polymerase specialized sigma24 family protein
MIDSLLEKLPRRSGDEHANRTQSATSASSEYSILAALPIVHRIVARRRSRLDPANRSDLVQEVALRIWRWRAKYPDKSEQMSGEDWNSFVARTAYNEVNRQFSREDNRANLPLEAVSEIEQPSVEGETDVEVFSLIQQVWQATCNLSLRQRRSLLLHSQELIIYFLQIGITENDLAEVLDFSETIWETVRDRLPMTDLEIAEIIEGKAGSIKKARYEARAKLEGSIRR